MLDVAKITLLDACFLLTCLLSFRPVLVIGSYSGLLKVWNYEKK